MYYKYGHVHQTIAKANPWNKQKRGFSLQKVSNSKPKAVLFLFLLVLLNELQLFCSCQIAVHWSFAMYDIFYLFQRCFQTFLKLSLTVQPTVLKKRQKFGDVVKDIFPSQWFFHALYKKTGWRDMRPPRSDFLWNWLAHMTQIVSVEPNWDISRVSNIESDNS